MKIIIFDTSSILFCLSNGIDMAKAVNEAFPGYKIAVSKGIIRELEGLGKSRRRAGRYAKAAVDVLGHIGVQVLDNSDNADKWLLSIADDKKVICTNDSKLKRALRGKGAIVVSVARSGMLR